MAPHWRTFAACRTKPNAWWFEWKMKELALAVCAKCGVREKCLEFAVDERIDEGIWGGKTPPQLRKLIKDRRIAKYGGTSQGTDSPLWPRRVGEDTELLDGGEVVAQNEIPRPCLCGGFGLCRGQNDAWVS